MILQVWVTDLSEQPSAKPFAFQIEKVARVGLLPSHPKKIPFWSNNENGKNISPSRLNFQTFFVVGFPTKKD